ncbi:LysR family transcriptional regulator [Massilia sp. erpn]|uniref:LysR family transcriptional regulator n=1 Tax=Massilia sp. erpn TaxID=2738142 RepID=UPI002103C924|nr:LysR family transcriptional regulator [Massilia sp. erpn]UTY59290.1 LysR family transcriptional regulator [Massilia sp. erpn]
MESLDDYLNFIAIVDAGSLTAAARNSGRSLQSVSRSLATLEAALGAQLIQRTTRKLHTTPAGAAFHERMRLVLADIAAARAEVRSETRVVSGSLRVGGPALFGSTYLAGMAASFMQRWPEVKIDLVLGDRHADLVADKLDLAIRLGALPDSSLHARPLGNLRRVFFASPSWLRTHGQPETPEALANLPCVVRTIGRDSNRWPYILDGEVRHVRVAGAFRANDAAACNEAVACGAGAGMAPYWQVRRLLDEGRVTLMLANYEPPPIPVQAVWHASARLPARTRLLIDHFALQFSSLRW